MKKTTDKKTLDLINEIELFSQEYDGEGLYDLSRDIHEALDSRFNESVKEVPRDEHGVQKGTFKVTMTWSQMNKDFFNIVLKEPTQEELLESNRDKWNLIEPILLHKTYNICSGHQIPTYFATLELDDEVFKCFDGYSSKKVKDFFVSSVFGACKKLQTNKLFVKCDIRSPKDFGNIPISPSNATDLLDMFFASERILDDMFLCNLYQKKMTFAFRKWIDFSTEFRLFIKNGDLVAFCENIDYQKFPNAIWSGINVKEYLNDFSFMAEKIVRDTKQSNLVVDVGFDQKHNLFLIELNPWGLSEPIYFRSYEAFNNEKIKYAFNDNGILKIDVI